MNLQILKDLLTSEKGFFALALLIGATVLAIRGQMTVEAWSNYTLVVYAAFAGGTGLRAIGQGLGNRREIEALRAQLTGAAPPDGD